MSGKQYGSMGWRYVALWAIYLFSRGWRYIALGAIYLFFGFILSPFFPASLRIAGTIFFLLFILRDVDCGNLGQNEQKKSDESYTPSVPTARSSWAEVPFCDTCGHLTGHWGDTTRCGNCGEPVT